MDLSTAIDNVKSSIDAYRKVSTWIPNDDLTDNLLKSALNDDITWAGLGAVCANRGPRMAYLQKPIESLSKPFENTLGMQFDKGTMGWWFSYGMTNQYGWVVIVFRYPTVGNSQKSATGDNAVYNLGGYILADGVRYPFSADGYPLTCSGSYTEDTSPSGTKSCQLVLTSTDFDSNAMISDFVITTMDNGFYQVASTFTDGGNVTIQTTSSYAAVPHGNSKGCAPCADGVGTNYWSWTYMPGQMQYNPSGGSGVIKDVVGWFDHQWAVMGIAPQGAVPQILATASRWLSPGSPAKWIWCTVVLDKSLQYSCSVILDEDDEVKQGSVFTNNSGGTKYTYDDDGNPTVEYNLPVSIKVVTIVDDVLSRHVTVTIEGVEYDLRGLVADGYVTLASGSINQEVPCFVHDIDTGDVVGQGFLEMNQMHSATDNATDALQVMGLDASKENLNVLLPRKYSFSQAWASVMVIVAVLLLVLAVVGLAVWGVVKLV